MKRLLILLATISIMMACNNEKKKDDKMGDDKKDTKMSDKINLPYQVEYADFKMGDPNHTKLVLDFYKTFEENRMDDGKAMLNDSVSVSFADGNKFMGPADSLLSLGKQVRGSFSAYKVTIDACMAVHSNDKNEDWVLIWNREYTTDQKGKVDSMGGHSYWQIKNGKIAFWAEQQAKLTPSAAMK
jgi:hypothetical protein